MKMLTGQQIDYHAARVICNNHDWQEHLSIIIAQAKLAATIQQKAAEICSGRMGRGPLDPDGDYWYDTACGECRDAILNMDKMVDEWTARLAKSDAAIAAAKEK